MWIYVSANRGDTRNWRWDIDGGGGRRFRQSVKDFEVGDRSEATFLRLLKRLSDTERYRLDAYGVYG